MPSRICLYVRELEPPYDEGFRNFMHSLLTEAPARRKALRLGHGDPEVFDVDVGDSRFGITRTLRNAIRGFRPEAVVYIPDGPVSAANLIRARLLKWYAGNAPTAVVCLQPPRSASFLLRALRTIAPPDMVYAQSEAGRKALAEIGFNAGIVRSGVDARRFRPADPDEKARLREQFGIDPSAYVVLHVGHVKEGRNLRVLGDIASSVPNASPLVVGSTSTTQEADLAAWLKGNGVRILDGYIERIEDLYRLADLYLFPVVENNHAVEMPLSVLEAMACNLPVVTTRFGALPECFDEGDGLYYADTDAEMLEKIGIASKADPPNTRPKMDDYTWESVAERLFSEVDGLAESRHVSSARK